MVSLKQKAFTLIELLVVIAIIGLLASIVLVSLQGAAASARDGKRDAEAGEENSVLRKTLEVYHNTHGTYPWNAASEAIDGCCLESNSDVKDALVEYLSDELKDPLYDPAEPDTLDRRCYRYKTINSGEEYKVMVNYETGGYKEIASWGGGGIVYETTEFLITNCIELQNMKNNLSATYYLANDIDCSDTVNWNTGAGFEPIGSSITSFNGNFDGQNHKITDLYINRPATDYVGLFGYVGTGNEIKNVGLENNDITGEDEVGGLIGYVINAIVNDSYSTGAVSGTSAVGGLIGYNSAIINNSYTTGNITGEILIGGLIGYTIDGTINNSYAIGNASGTNYIGGLIGYSRGTINNSYAIGNADGTNHIGGLIGYSRETINNCYSTGAVSGTSAVGGLIGTDVGTTTDSYWDTETSGQAISAGGTGKTTAEMKQQTTFVDWDFGSLWNIEENVTYPFFR